MTDIFKVNSDIKDAGDSLPPESGTYGPLPTGLYPVIVKLAYMSQSSKGANGLNLHLSRVDNSAGEIRQTLWVTSGKAKGQKNYYTDRNGVKHLLPGMANASQLHELITGKPLDEANIEKKLVKLWNYDTKQEEPTEVPVLMDLLKQPVIVGLTKNVANKNALNADGDWVPTADLREFNEIEKFFSPDGHTLVEKKAGGEAKFVDQWKKRFPEDYVRDRSTKVEDASTSVAAATGTDDKLESLFD